MAQHREAPAFEEYAASMMARTGYRVMSLGGRSLLYTLRLECWVNGCLPADASLLARVLGFDAAEVERLLPEVADFFVIDGSGISCPELDDYRAHLEDRRTRQSQGGKAGAAKTNRLRKPQDDREPVAGQAAGKPQARRESLVKPSLAKLSKTKVLNEAVSPDPWLNDYERASQGA